ncbi:MAG: ATP-binding protein [Desulfosarcinaceae bacterium]|nr:ATP-binding protein [Desulfosarcinaceae bacterium]
MRYKSLPLRINIAIISTALVIVVLFGMFLYPLEHRRADVQVQRINLLLDTIFRQKLNDLANELFARQERALRASLDEIVNVDDVLGAAIYLPDGGQFMSNHPLAARIDPRPQRLATAPGSIFERLSGEDASVGVYLNRIEVIGQIIGYIAIYYDFTDLDREIWQSVAIFSGLLATTVLLMGVLLNRFLFRSVIQPVSLLRNAMRRVEEGGLGETVALPRTDEIGDMGAAFNDMSVRLRQVHNALMDAEEKYRSIFENAIEGIFQCTPGQGRFLTVNSALSAMLGYQSGQELMGAITDISSQLFLNRSDAIRFETELQAADRTVGFETALCCLDGSTITVSISARRVKDDAGAVQYVEGSVEDITERRQREEAERKQEAAEAASRAKSEFLAYMSHEIRTPINAILGFADVMEAAEKDPRKKHYIQVIKSSGASLLQLINDILDLSKIEAGRMEIQATPVNLALLFRELDNIFSAGALAKGLDLSLIVSHAFPSRLLLDKVRMRQVLFNLIGNAVKYTPNGGVRVSAAAERSAAERCWDLTITVADTGIGIDPEAHEEVFQSFRQHRTMTTPQAEGTGLGLPISKNLVEMMGGQIALQSQTGEGSVFTITLPQVPEPESARQEASPEAADRDESQRIAFEPATVLLADDLEINRQLIIEALRHSPLAISEATNGREALNLARETRPDIILMDIRMPEMDGHTAIAHIQQEPELAAVPVIALTASGMKEDIAQIQRSGFDDYLIRPFNREQLLAILMRHLPCSRVGHEHRPHPGRGIEWPPPIYLSAWKCPVAAARQLKGALKERWQETQRKQKIPDIRDFGAALADLGRDVDAPALEAYGTDLCRHADNFQIDQIKHMLGCYEKMLEMMDG